MKQMNVFPSYGVTTVGAVGLTAALALFASSDGVAGEIGDLADMEPVTLVVQSPYGPNHFMSEMWVDYANAVEKRSSGAITFDISYSSVLSPVAEQEQALRDGLLDMAWSMPAYNPTALPLNALVTEAAFLTEQTPVVSQLQGYGSSQFGMESEALQEELKGAGIVSLLTMVQQMPNNPLLCKGDPVQSLEDFAGKRIRVPGSGWATEVRALGATPVNLVQAEVYEAMQRGVIDCAVQSPGNSVEMGLFDVADYFVVDTQVNFQGWNGTHITIAERVWDELPVKAQQILWDEAGETLLRSMIDRSMAAIAEELRAAAMESEIIQYEEDVRHALTAQRQKTLKDLDARATKMLGEGQTLLQDYQEAQDEWLTIVTEDLGYADAEYATWLEWAESYEENPTDIDAFIEVYMERVMNPNRPE
ncbi:TRAP transporter substrate-binding protein DctP [Vreelandella glaciei]|uniref:TRAP transporter substrate-binding protein DctP n=1 Tax=Vreelandella glaciei TaxID=186761 RepID=UPI003002B798